MNNRRLFILLLILAAFPLHFVYSRGPSISNYSVNVATGIYRLLTSVDRLTMNSTTLLVNRRVGYPAVIQFRNTIKWQEIHGVLYHWHCVCHAIVQSISFIIAIHYADNIFIRRVVTFVKTFIITFGDKLYYIIFHSNKCNFSADCQFNLSTLVFLMNLALLLISL